MNDTLYDTLSDKACDIFLVFFCDTLHKKTPNPPTLCSTISVFIHHMDKSS